MLPEQPVARDPEVRPAKRRLRLRVAFRLRTMMVLVLVVAVWVAWQVNRARGIRRAVQTIEKMGGQVKFAQPVARSNRLIAWFRVPNWLRSRLGEEYFSDVRGVSILDRKDHAKASEFIKAASAFPRLQRFMMLSVAVGDEDMAALANLTRIEQISIAEPFELQDVDHARFGGSSEATATAPKLTSNGLCQLKRLTSLKSIRLGIRPAIDTSVLDAWSHLEQLSTLWFMSPKLKDDELQALGKFHHLEELKIDGEIKTFAPRTSRPLPIASWGKLRKLSIAFIDLTPDEYQALSQLSKLEEIMLLQVRTKDSDLLLLREMKGLKELHLSGTRVTPEGVEALRAALPNLSIQIQ